MAISDDFISYLRTVDLAAKFHPTQSLCTVLSPNHLVKLLHTDHLLEELALLQPIKGRRLACEFKDCLWISGSDRHDHFSATPHLRVDVEAHVQSHLDALGGESMKTPVLWKDVPLAQSSDGLDIFPCFWKCNIMWEAPKGAQLLEHLVEVHYPGYVMYSCPMCRMNLALEVEEEEGEDVPTHVRVNMALIFRNMNLRQDAMKIHDAPDVQAQRILLEHYKEGCPEFSPWKSPLWNDLPDDLKERLDEQLKALSVAAEKQSVQ
ncbi:hypothetical protein EV122DRAFT_212049 [Schizophyllum commune]